MDRDIAGSYICLIQPSGSGLHPAPGGRPVYCSPGSGLVRRNALATVGRADRDKRAPHSQQVPIETVMNTIRTPLGGMRDVMLAETIEAGGDGLVVPVERDRIL